MNKNHSTQIDKSKPVSVNNEEMKQKMEEIRLKAKKMRDERILKHAARIQSLKTMNLQKYGDHSIISNMKPQLSSNTAKVLGLTNKYNTFEESTKLLTKTTTVSTKAPLKETNKTAKSLNATNNEKKDTRKSMSIHYNYGYSRLPFANQAKSESIQSDDLKTITSDDLKTITTKDVDSKPDHSKTKNITKKIDMSSIARLSKPRFINSVVPLGSAPPRPKTNKSAPSVAESQPKKSQRWTMASIDRLSKPKIVSQPISSHFTKPQRVENIRRTISAPSQVVRKQKSDDKVEKVSVQLNSTKLPVNYRRSLSTVHFKRMGAGAAKQCVQRTLSSGNIKNKEFDETIISSCDYVLPVESERKKSVKFFTPIRKSSTPMFLNTPKPSELRKRLNDWLQKRGKSLSTYHHLQCFGVHGFKKSEDAPKPIDMPTNDENKENEEIEDDDSFSENMTGHVKDNAAEWRSASYKLADSPTVSDNTGNYHVLRELTPKPLEDIVPITSAALNDLHQLILEGYSWHQCAEWLRAVVRTCGESVTNSVPYWECRAALEEKRGDFPRAVECYNKAIQQGAQPSDVEACLDTLLEKFMKLNLDPYSVKNAQIMADSKLVDVKNVFKSTLIRFAIQQKSIKDGNKNSTNSPKFTATPVRRSSRLSYFPEVNGRKVATPINRRNTSAQKANINFNGNSKENDKFPDKVKHKFTSPISQSAKKLTGRKTLVQLCSSLRNIDEDIKQSLLFVPNKALTFDEGL